MHECSNHIQHEGEARGLYVVTHECIIPYSTSRGVLTGLYPTVDLALQVWCLSLTTGPGTCSSQLYHRAIS